MNARRLTLATLVSLGFSLCLLGISGVATAVALTQTKFAPGQLLKPSGVAVDQAAGNDVYVVESWEGQLDAFDDSGSLISEFGKTQFGSSPGRNGSPGPTGVAVDNELGSLSYGDVYVFDSANNRVEKFDSSGNFLLMFGGGVNEATSGDVCVAGEACRKGTPGSSDGQFESAFYTSFIAVGPAGRVYVGDRARVQVFEPSGVWRENILLAGLSSTGKVTALAVDSTGDMFVKVGNQENREGAVAGVREFAPNGTEEATQFDTGSETVQALAVGPSGEVFVADSSGGGHVLEYDANGKQLASIGSNISKFVNGMTYASALNELYVTEFTGVVWVLAPPVPGPPTIEEGSLSASPGLRGQASLAAMIGAGAFETKYHFEYIDQADFEAGGYAKASSTPVLSVPATLEAQSVNVVLTGLTAGSTYHYRLVARNSKGTITSPDQSFVETPAALIKGPWVTNVAATSATLGAEIDPLGAATEYSLEYGTSTSYTQSLTGNVGASEAYVPVAVHSQELAPGTVYHYRVVTHNQFGTVEGPDQTFTTQPPGAASALPDGRAWELVSPADKKGALIGFFGEAGDQIQAASDGSGVTYLTEGPHVGEGALGKIKWSMVLSRRPPAGGWGSEDLTIPARLPEKEEPTAEIAVQKAEYHLFSPDLSLGAIEPLDFETEPLSPETTERTVYLRNDANRSFVPLVTPADVPPGTRIEEPSLLGVSHSAWGMHFVAATPDLSHVLLSSPMALTAAHGKTPAAIEEESVQKPSFYGEPQRNLYEWAGGQLQLVNVLPNGEATHGFLAETYSNAGLAGVTFAEGSPHGGGTRAVSNDGRRIAWQWHESGNGDLYVRDMVEERTVQVGGLKAVFQVMSSDGSKVFYLENGDLYEFDYETGAQTDLTSVHGAGESSAGVQESVSDVSEDGSYVYFVATGALANGGAAGEDNLYLLHDTASGWSTTHIATLSPEDEHSWHAASGTDLPDLAKVSSRVSPDGRYLAFMSRRSLTGYDNFDAVSGVPDQEVYLYDADTGKLVCASCNPTGARPVGVYDNSRTGGEGEALLVDTSAAWTGSQESDEKAKAQWLAGSIPGWDVGTSRNTTYQPRYLDDSGRLFFESPDALVPQDTNGLEDVYEYEPTGVGGCVAGGAMWSERSSGCVNLISSGTASAESAFYDASENGDDVFFITTAKLVGEDYDKGYDVYDAHVCSGAVPCGVVPVSSPPCTSGDSCKAAPSPQPEIFGPTPSATFNGVGNVTPAPSVHVSARSLTRAQKLARALRACRKKRGRTARGVCERQARRRYVAKRSRTARATTKGIG
jgi:hypothetical protein